MRGWHVRRACAGSLSPLQSLGPFSPSGGIERSSGLGCEGGFTASVQFAVGALATRFPLSLAPPPLGA